MATTGPALTIPFVVGASKIVGQGDDPIVRAYVSTDDVSNPTPNDGDETPFIG